MTWGLDHDPSGSADSPVEAVAGPDLEPHPVAAVDANHLVALEIDPDRGEPPFPALGRAGQAPSEDVAIVVFDAAERHLFCRDLEALQGRAQGRARRRLEQEDGGKEGPRIVARLPIAARGVGISLEQVALGRVEDHDCYVFGGRLPHTPEGQEQRLPSLWIDLESYEVVRIDRRDGVRFEIGPTNGFEGGIRAPGWIAIEAPGQPPARLDILRVAPAEAPAAAFGTDWLTAPRIP